jgi:hypothetical protein
LLDRGANVNDRHGGGGTSLIDASYAGHKEVVELLLDRGADVSVMTNDGRTAFDIASDHNHDHIARTLHRWPFTMGLLSLQELSLYYKLDCSSIIDFWQYIV